MAQPSSKQVSRSVRLAIALAVACSCMPERSAHAQQPEPFVVFDGFFSDSNWQVTTFPDDADQFAHRSRAGGNPGSFRNMAHNLTPNVPMAVYHLRLGSEAVYDPSKLGAIAGITYFEDQKEFNPPFAGAAVGALFFVAQGNRVHFGPDLSFTTTEWTRRKLSCLKPEDFTMSFDELPDFSATAEPLRFGYLRSNTNSGSSEIQIAHGIDNFHVVVYPAPNPGCAQVTCTGFEETLFCGDLNRDCTITSGDALIVLQISVGAHGTNPAGDLDGSGKITASDALKDLRIAVLIDPQGATFGLYKPSA